MASIASSSAGSTDPTTAVMAALRTLYHDPEASNKKRANEWLEEFQHSVEAWQTCHTLLTAEGSPLEGRLFGAQTFRAKILYDLTQLPTEQLTPLRDSLLSTLTPLISPSAPTGSKAVLIQLCLALADLALLMPTWQNVVGSMIEQFGKDPSTVGVLLNFLKALVEELGNPRLPLSTDQLKAGAGIEPWEAEQVLQVLTMYIQAPGLTTAIQTTVFDTLRAWTAAGELSASQVSKTPLFDALFAALASDQLFDSAVDCICDMIHETQEVEDNAEVIQIIVPRLIALRPQLEEHKEDADRIRGYCRMFCEAGECYKDLIVRHPSDLLPLVEAIAACASYPDLDIVPITFNFWYTLATAMGRQPTAPSLQPILDIYSNLQTVIISHLHFPADDEDQTPQERDEFRMFRHRMGDTLKDCCHVLGAPTCLRKSYDIIQTALSKPSPGWQEIEAPLFSMRSMGAEVDPDDDEVLPHIMDMLPKLPEHPRIRYAAILVISRYTQWIDRHPQNLAFQLQYISAGFTMAEEVSAAAAQAMKFMCQDCNSHLVPFLPQLYEFVESVGNKLDQCDMVEVCEAIGYVISCMPSSDAAAALQQFCTPLIGRVQVVANAGGEVAKPDIQKAADALEQIDAYLTVVKTLNPVPESCFPTALAVYQVLDTLLSKYAKLYYISERVGSVLRRGLAFFPDRALGPVVPSLLERMVSAFEETGYASYLWIIGKTAAKFGSNAVNGGESLPLMQMLGKAFEGVTTSLSKLLTVKVAVEIPDVMDDYSHCFMAYITAIPNIILSSPLLHLAISHTLAALTCPAPETTLIALDTLALLSNRLLTAQYHPLLQPVFAQYGKAIVNLVINGVVQDFPEDGLDQVQDIMAGSVVVAEPGVVEGWVQDAIGGIPGHVVPVAEKHAFMRDLHEHLAEPGSDKLRNAINNLVRAARRARERGRQSRKSLGTGI